MSKKDQKTEEEKLINAVEKALGRAAIESEDNDVSDSSDSNADAVIPIITSLIRRAGRFHISSGVTIRIAFCCESCQPTTYNIWVLIDLKLSCK